MTRPLLQIAYRLRRLAQRVLRLKTVGVKVMLFDADERLLLIRNTYGKSHLWMLPGGGVHRGEAVEGAAARELQEEVGIAAEDLAPFATFTARGEGRRDTVHVFTACTAATPRIDGVEVSEARFFALDALPDTVSKATRRRIEEYGGKRPPGGTW